MSAGARHARPPDPSPPPAGAGGGERTAGAAVHALASPAAAHTDDGTSGYDAARATLLWQLAARAIDLALADPDGLGGIVLHGRHGAAREALLARLERRGDVRRVPADADEEALVGGVDVGATLATGRAVRHSGLLETPSATTLLLGGAERLPGASAARLCAWLDDGPTAHSAARSAAPPGRRARAGVGAKGVGAGANDDAGPDANAYPYENEGVGEYGHAGEYADANVYEGGNADERRKRSRPPRAPLVALDESEDGATLIGSALGERLALHVEVPELALAELDGLREEDGAASRARIDPGAVSLPDETLEEIVRVAVRLGVDSIRAPLHACRVARVAAALGGRDAVGTADAALAVQLVLAPRARLLPDRREAVAVSEGPGTPDEPLSDDPQPADPDAGVADAEPSSLDPEASGADDAPADHGGGPERRDAAPERGSELPPGGSSDAERGDGAGRDEPLAERLVDAAVAALPARLLDDLETGAPRLAGGTFRRSRGGGGGRSPRAGRDAGDAGERGRPIGTRRARGRSPASLNLVATLKAAIPLQRLRGPSSADRGREHEGGQPRVRVRREDFRVTRRRRPVRTTTVFVVDASGSAAMHRLAEAKGAVERLLAECYVRRDRVALIAFRGRGATLELPPTRSLSRARRSLAGLPGGGGTPLAAGLDAAADLLERLAREGERPVGVVMSDASANVARDGTGSRSRATEDAAASAERLARLGVRLLFVDTAPRPRPRAAELATRMRARYLALPQLDTALVGGGGR